MSTVSLFPSDERRRFMATTANRYRHLEERYARKKLPPPPFTLSQLREHIYNLCDSGAFKCRYCGRICDISEVELDHAMPLARGGTLSLENIEAPCAGCNAAKGSMNPTEFSVLLNFLEHEIPYARTDVLERLTKYGKLVASKRKADMLLRNQGQFPQKSKKQKPPLIRAIDEVF